MGVKQWLFQRASNLVFVLFGAWFLITFLGGGFASFQDLEALMNNATAKFVLGIVLALAVCNSILAGWQIAGDYAHKINVSANLIVAFIVLVSVGYLAVGAMLLV